MRNGADSGTYSNGSGTGMSLYMMNEVREKRDRVC
jgi:hypothetical protein